METRSVSGQEVGSPEHIPHGYGHMVSCVRGIKDGEGRHGPASTDMGLGEISQV